MFTLTMPICTNPASTWTNCGLLFLNKQEVPRVLQTNGPTQRSLFGLFSFEHLEGGKVVELRLFLLAVKVQNRCRLPILVEGDQRLEARSPVLSEPRQLEEVPVGICHVKQASHSRLLVSIQRICGSIVKVVGWHETQYRHEDYGRERHNGCQWSRDIALHQESNRKNYLIHSPSHHLLGGKFFDIGNNVNHSFGYIILWLPTLGVDVLY